MEAIDLSLVEDIEKHAEELESVLVEIAKQM